MSEIESGGMQAPVSPLAAEADRLKALHDAADAKIKALEAQSDDGMEIDMDELARLGNDVDDLTRQLQEAYKLQQEG